MAAMEGSIYVWGVTDRSRGLHAHIKGKRGEYGIMGEIRKAVVCIEGTRGEYLQSVTCVMEYIYVLQVC